MDMQSRFSRRQFSVAAAAVGVFGPFSDLHAQSANEPMTFELRFIYKNAGGGFSPIFFAPESITLTAEDGTTYTYGPEFRSENVYAIYVDEPGWYSLSVDSTGGQWVIGLAASPESNTMMEGEEGDSSAIPWLYADPEGMTKADVLMVVEDPEQLTLLPRMENVPATEFRVSHDPELPAAVPEKQSLSMGGPDSIGEINLYLMVMPASEEPALNDNARVVTDDGSAEVWFSDGSSVRLTDFELTEDGAYRVYGPIGETAINGIDPVNTDIARTNGSVDIASHSVVFMIDSGNVFDGYIIYGYE